jgi:hypothetical protein
MTPRSIFLTTAIALACIAAALIILEISSIKEPTADEWRELLTKNIESIFPNSVRSCGYVRVGEDSAQAKSCIAATEAANQTYWIAYQAVGTDSIVWLVAFKNADKKIVEYSFDSFGWRQRGNASYVLKQRNCDSLVLAAPKSFPAFICN